MSELTLSIFVGGGAIIMILSVIAGNLLFNHPSKQKREEEKGED